MQSLNNLTPEEKELKVLISSLKNVLTDVPYDFVYDDYEEFDDNDEIDDDEYYD